MKKIVFLLVSLLLLLSAAPISADNTRTSGLYTYEIKGNGTITITDFDWENNEADVFIPNMIDGYSVTGIGDGAFAYGEIGKKNKKRNTHYVVTLQDGITTIGDKAFWNADISEINIPSSVQRIGVGAFYGCPSCQFKVAPNHSYFAVIDVGLYEKSRKELLALSWKNARKVTIPEGIQSIGAYSIARAIIDVVSPSTLTAIGDYAFWQSSASLSGDLSHLTTIGVGAFMDSSVIEKDLTLPSVETIGEMAFQDARIEANLDFTGAPIKQLKAKTFYNAYNLLSERCAIIFTDSSLEQIGDDVFNDHVPVPTSDVPVPTFELAKCSDIGRGNSGLGQVMTEESDFSPLLTTIPTGLNPQVTSLPSTVTAIESGAFTEAVSDFHLSASLKDIAVDAFPRGSTFIVDAGSYAELWCSENGFGYSIEGQNNLDWLNN